MSATRINPETGIIEEDTSLCGGTFGYTWEAKENSEGRAERIDPETGVHQEDRSLFNGVFGHSWEDKD